MRLPKSDETLHATSHKFGRTTIMETHPHIKPVSASLSGDLTTLFAGADEVLDPLRLRVAEESVAP